jgi:hypothetical protein
MRLIKRIIFVLLLTISGIFVKDTYAQSNKFVWNIEEITIPLNSNFNSYLNQFEPKFYYNGKITNQEVTVTLDPLYYGSLAVDTSKPCDKQVALLAYVSGYTNFERKSIIAHIKDEENPDIINIKELVFDYGEEFTPSNYFLIKDNDILDKNTILYDYNVSELSVVGSHKITVSASDVSGNHTVKTYDYVVRDLSKPLINVSSVIEIEYGNSLFDIKDFANAFDSLDGDITSSISQTGLDVFKLGNQKIKIEVTDSSGNTSTVTKEVKVVDLRAPILELSTYKTIIDINNAKDIDFKSYISNFSDDTTELTIDDVKIDLEDFSYTIGSHYIYYYLFDNANNYIKRVLEVDIRFCEPPIIEADDLTFNKGETFDLRKYIKVSSKYDNNVNNNYYLDEHILNREVPGTYEIIINAMDYAGNEAEKKIYVTIKNPEDSIENKSLNAYNFLYNNKIIILVLIFIIFGVITYMIKKKNKKLGM